MPFIPLHSDVNQAPAVPRSEDGNVLVGGPNVPFYNEAATIQFSEALQKLQNSAQSPIDGFTADELDAIFGFDVTTTLAPYQLNASSMPGAELRAQTPFDGHSSSVDLVGQALQSQASMAFSPANTGTPGLSFSPLNPLQNAASSDATFTPELFDFNSPVPCLANPTFPDLELSAPGTENRAVNQYQHFWDPQSIAPHLYLCPTPQDIISISLSSSEELAPALQQPAPPSSTGTYELCPSKTSSSKKTRSSYSAQAPARKPVLTPPTPAASKRYLCDECNKDFSTKKNVKRHKTSEHRGIRWFCPNVHSPYCACKKNGYAREDAFLRQLKLLEDNDECAVKARSMGWSKHVVGSVQRLRRPPTCS